MNRPLSAATHHRPWPRPASPWVMAQEWCNLLFAHWPLPAAALQALLPPALTLDTFEGQAWLGIVPFQMRGVRPRLTPSVPWLSAFPELNVRTYVRLRDRGLEKSGVYFFSLDAANPVAVRIARRTFHLPYFDAAMRAHYDGRTVHYASRRTHRGAPAADLVAGYRPTGPRYRTQSGDLDHWLTERYCLYTVDQKGHPLIGEIHHAPWPLQPATAEFLVNTMAGAAAIRLPDAAPLLHFARRLEVIVWPLRLVEP
ncbi:MAG: DUF2071 domain-containing protein [Anaerolineales bacterium]|nr:DUF2071 domain-containing protein [Anaerolineales bacterium]